MDPLTIIILLVIGFLFLKGGTGLSSVNGGGLFSSLGIGIDSSGIPPQAQFIQGTGNLSAAQQNQFAAIQAGNTALNAIPVVGPALSAVASAITASLVAASKKRAQEATNENTAVAAAVPGWDQTVYTLKNGYNDGSLSASQAIALVDLAWNNYWQEVGPKVQPGRNGCNSGNLSKQQADSQFPGLKQCSGNWGAGCCVAYADLANGALSIKAAISQTENTGKSAIAYIPAVFASKYGGTNRQSYTLTFTRPSSSFVI